MTAHVDGVLDWRVSAADAEICAAQLWGMGAHAVLEQNDPSPSDLTEWHEHLHVVLVAGFGAPEQLRAAQRACNGSVIRSVDNDWRDAWKAHVVPYHVGPVCVVPAWCEAPPGAPLSITIDPGRSFGLNHATTRLCISALATHMAVGDEVLDVGCGSGVLSIVAARLGARGVTAIDVAPEALVDTASNAARNGVFEQLAVSGLPIASVVGTFDVIVANLGGAEILVAMSDEFRRLTQPGGRVLLGGLLTVNLDACLMAFAWAHVVDQFTDEDWHVVVLQQPAQH